MVFFLFYEFTMVLSDKNDHYIIKYLPYLSNPCFVGLATIVSFCLVGTSTLSLNSNLYQLKTYFLRFLHFLLNL